MDTKNSTNFLIGERQLRTAFVSINYFYLALIYLSGQHQRMCSTHSFVPVLIKKSHACARIMWYFNENNLKIMRNSVFHNVTKIQYLNLHTLIFMSIILFYTQLFRVACEEYKNVGVVCDSLISIWFNWWQIIH